MIRAQLLDYLLKVHTRCPALNGNKIKHYIFKMKADIKQSASPFNVVILPAFLPLGQVIFLPALKRIRPTSTYYVFLVKQHFMCMEQSTGTIFMYGEMKILMLLNMSGIH
jgi:hypothetical protein